MDVEEHTDNNENSVEDSVILLTDDHDVYFLRSAVTMKKDSVLVDERLEFKESV